MLTDCLGFKVPVWSSPVFGIVSCLSVTLFKWISGIFARDKPLYVFIIHAGGGLVGMFLTGAFAR
jgi:Amt family ammonium transporter